MYAAVFAYEYGYTRNYYTDTMGTLRQSCVYEGINFYGSVAKRMSDSAVWWIFKEENQDVLLNSCQDFRSFSVVSQLMGSMHKQILHTQTHTHMHLHVCTKSPMHTQTHTSSSWKTPSYLGTADCKLLSNKGFLGDECEVPSLLPWCLQLVMRQSYQVKLWESMHGFVLA